LLLPLSLTRNAPFLVSILIGLCLTLAACDREAPDAAQEHGALQGEKPSLTGEIDAAMAGSLLPAVTLTDLEGNQINLAALQGEPLLVNIWATFCAPCKVEMPMLDDLAADLEGEVRILTVSQDFKGSDAVGPYFARMQFKSLPSWIDQDGALGLAVGSGVLPTTILYDAAGQEIWRVVGDYDWSSAEAREAILAALASEE